MQNIKWFSVPRMNLPDTVHGFSIPAEASPCPDIGQQSTDGLVVGYADSPTIATPAIVGVIDESRSAELFSWLSTFAPEAFPISQSFRVVSLSDWDAGVSELSLRSLVAKDHIWPSLILGEIIGQGDREKSIASIPLSRVFASFTYAQARACLSYEKHPTLINECRNRLSLLESDTSFVKRAISVDSLSAMWDVANGNGDNEYLEILRFVARTVDYGPREGLEPLPPVFQKLGLNHELIASDSIEQRVLEFERVIVQLDSRKQQGFNPALALAALAILVGRSTTHITLLEEYAHEYPTAVCWFGLLAGMVGPTIWDEKWLRLSTSVERLLRATVSLTDPATADLCWIEYFWMRGLRQSSAWMRDTPKLYPRVLSVEILPGVSCQLRLRDSGQTASKLTLPAQQMQEPAPQLTLLSTADDEPQNSRRSRETNDASRTRRTKLLSKMRTELSRLTETLATLEREEDEQPQLFDSPESDEAVVHLPQTFDSPEPKGPATKTSSARKNRGPAAKKTSKRVSLK